LFYDKVCLDIPEKNLTCVNPFRTLFLNMILTLGGGGVFVDTDTGEWVFD